jgi:hypothetical protein
LLGNDDDEHRSAKHGHEIIPNGMHVLDGEQQNASKMPEPHDSSDATEAGEAVLIDTSLWIKT